MHCGHYFHIPCINEAFINQGLYVDLTCPLCRRKVDCLDRKIPRGMLRNRPELSGREIENFIMAARYGELAVVRFVVENYEISQEDRGKAVLDAAKYARQFVREIIQLLLEDHEILQSDRGKAVIASAWGNGFLVRSLLENHDISQEDRESAVFCAAHTGQIDTLKFLLDGHEIPIEARGQAVIGALHTREGKAAIQFLLDGHEILPKDREKAMIATAGHDESLFHFLIQNYKISPLVRLKAVIEALENNQTNILQFLLEGSKLSMKVRGWIVIAGLALSKDNETAIRFLLEGYQISPKHRGLALQRAAAIGKESVVRWLWKQDEILGEDWLKAVIGAVKSNQVANVQFLLEKHAISIEERGKAVIAAASQNCDNEMTIRFLLEGQQISSKHRGFALQKATALSKEPLIHLLLANGEIPIKDRGILVIQAIVKKFDETILQLLLGHSEILESHRDFAIQVATARAEESILQYLLATHEISPEAKGLAMQRRGRAVLTAIAKRKMKSLRFLIKNNQEILLEDLDLAVAKSVEQENLESVTLLMKRPISRPLRLQLIKKALFAKKFEMARALTINGDLITFATFVIGMIASYGV